MNINNFKNLHLIFNEVKYNYFKTSAVIVLLGTINILMDVLGLATLVPIIDLVLNPAEAKDKYLIFLNFFKPNIENTEELILIFIGIILLLNLIKFIVTIINSYYSNFVLKDIKHLISKKILNNKLNTDYLSLKKMDRGDFIRNLYGEVNELSKLYLNINYFIIEILMSISLLILIVFVNYQVVIVFIPLSLIIFFIHSHLLKKKIVNLGTLRSLSQRKVISKLNQIYSSTKEIKLSHSQNKYIDDYTRGLRDIINVVFKDAFFQSIPRPLIELIFVSFFLFILGYINSTQNFLSILTILPTIILALMRLLPNLSRILNVKNTIYLLTISVSNVYKTLILEKNNQTYLNNNDKILEFKNLISIKNVSFCYDDENKKVLNTINFFIKKNSLFGIYGPSGSGKTTLLEIICGLIIPKDGVVLIDKNKLDINNSHSWQKNICYVAQDFYLFNDTIKQNITSSEGEKIDEKQLDLSINIAQLKNEIKNDKDFLNQQVGDAGQLISGGQAQRVAIARAIYQDRKILILDEPTSTLDEETRNNFLKDLNELKKEKTIIIISHDKKIINECDDIFELKMIC